MLRRAWHFLRSLVFYAGYGVSVVAWGLFMIAVAPWLDYPGRYRMLMVWNRFAIRWLRIAWGRCSALPIW